MNRALMTVAVRLVEIPDEDVIDGFDRQMVVEYRLLGLLIFSRQALRRSDA